MHFVSDAVYITSCFILAPVRNTSFGHLRDGFVRALQKRVSLGLKSGNLTSDEANSVQSPISQFKSLFPNASVQKGNTLDLIITASPSSAPKGVTDGSRERSLIVRDMGSVKSNWVAR